jgi:hypothetical protein
MKFGRYAENCCQILQDRVEYPDDLYLVQLVRMQRIADSSRTTLHNEALENSLEFPMLLSIGVASLEKSVQDMGATLDLELPQACERDPLLSCRIAFGPGNPDRYPAFAMFTDAIQP